MHYSNDVVSNIPGQSPDAAKEVGRAFYDLKEVFRQFPVFSLLMRCKHVTLT